MRAPQEIIKCPLLTEKSTLLRERGGGKESLSAEECASKVTFWVAKDANKIEIRKAVEKLFKVSVTSVRTQVVRGKRKRLGRYLGRRPGRKKAIITLQAGDTIEFFEGV